jgi:predicted nucleic acid-binding protein
MPSRTLYVAEPSQHYRTRPPLVVDCSLVSAWLFHEPTAGEAELRLQGHQLHAPDLLSHEIVSVALKKLQAGMALEQVQASLGCFVGQSLTLHRPDPLVQFQLAERYRLSSYDAAYLWLAAELRAPLVTFDAQLAKAASSHLSGAA